MSSFEYVHGKIAHLKRVGLVGGGKEGIGQHGGACPDWLVAAQKDEQKRLSKARDRQDAVAIGDGYGGPRHDIEWLVPTAEAAE